MSSAVIWPASSSAAASDPGAAAQVATTPAAAREEVEVERRSPLTNDKERRETVIEVLRCACAANDARGDDASPAELTERRAVARIEATERISKARIEGKRETA